MRDHPIRLHLELLEDRCVLSKVQLIGSNLFINASTTGGPITLTAVANNTFQLSGTVTGTFTVAGNIFIIGSDEPDTVTINLGPFNYAGNLFIFTHNGDDAININGNSVIGGNVYLLTGTGNDGVTVAETIGGNLTFFAQSGRDTFNFGSGSSVLGGALTVTNASVVNLGVGADRINGTVNVNSTLVNTGVKVTTSPGLTIGGDLFITTGSGNNVITFNAGNMNGLVSLNLGNGNSQVFNAGALNIAGDFDVFSGTGNNAITLATGTVIAGNSRINLGDGTNDLTGLTNAFTVQGNLELIAGNGNNTPFTFGGSVGGDADFRFGNGNDNVTIAGGVAGNLTWNSGNGNDTLTLAYSPAVPLYMVNVHFGNLDDVFATTGTGKLTGSIDGGGRLFGNTFNPSADTTIIPNFTLENFP